MCGSALRDLHDSGNLSLIRVPHGDCKYSKTIDFRMDPRVHYLLDPLWRNLYLIRSRVQPVCRMSTGIFRYPINNGPSG